jgi:ABC-2 type transport system permease protein
MSTTVPGAGRRQAQGKASDRSSGRGLGLLWHQVRYEQLTFWRNPQSAFFTFVFPVVIIVVFGLIFGGGGKSSFYYGRSALQYYVSTIAAMSVLGSCYSQLAIVLAMRRQDGILKRVRATPLPAGVYFVGLLAHCILVSVVDVLLIVGIGRIYGVSLPAVSQWPSLAVSLVLGAAAFCALGVAVASLIRNAEAAPAVVQFIQFPLIFISGSYFPIHAGVLNDITGVLPVKPFNDALLGAFATGSAGFPWKDYAVLLVWGVAGAAVALRRFRWDPRPE